MDSPWLAPADAGARLLVERAHDELLAGHADDPRLAHVRSIVRQSWRRSLEHLVGPEDLPPLDLRGDELEAYRSAHPLAGAMSMIRGLLLPGEASDAGVVVAVGDAAGRLLWIEGDRRVRSLTGDMGFVEGANWAEDRVGTAAPGTALALDAAVQVRGAEHFNRHVQQWSCTAAPVHDPETRALLGVIDVTGRDNAAHPQAQLLVEATVRAVEGELLIARMREREARQRSRTIVGSVARRRGSADPARDQAGHARALRPTLSVLGRDRARLEAVAGSAELSERHGEILLMLATHRQGLGADRLAELVYGDPHAVGTLRPEIVRLRRVLQRCDLELESRPYRLAAGADPVPLETDAQHVLSLLGRGAHRVALAAWRGDVLPSSQAPGVEALREQVRAALREAMLDDAGLDALLRYIETDAGRDDVEALRLCLGMLPPRSPKRAAIVARLDALEA